MVAPAATSGAGADPLVQVINFHREAGEDEDMEEEDESEFGEEDEDEMAEAETGARASGKATVPYVCGMCGKVSDPLPFLAINLNQFPSATSVAILSATPQQTSTTRLSPPRTFWNSKLAFKQFATHTHTHFVARLLPQGFKKKSLMTAHERIHNNDRPYACMDCPKAFRDLGALNSHKIRLHSRENLKFSCELCR